MILHKEKKNKKFSTTFIQCGKLYIDISLKKKLFVIRFDLLKTNTKISTSKGELILFIPLKLNKLTKLRSKTSSVLV